MTVLFSKKINPHLNAIPKAKLNTDNPEDQTEGDDQPFIWENVQFFVQDIHGHSHTFNLPLSTTVKELKEKFKKLL